MSHDTQYAIRDMSDWPTTFEEALAIQQQLRAQVVTYDDFGEIQTVAGGDAGYEEDAAGIGPGRQRLPYRVAQQPTGDRLREIAADRPLWRAARRARGHCSADASRRADWRGA